MRTKRIFIVLLALCLGSPSGWADSVPKLINYQGKLTNAEGLALADGEYQLEFRLYDAPEGGTLVWGEQRTVTLFDGVFSLALGAADAALAEAPVKDLRFAFGDAGRFLQTVILSGPQVSVPQTLLPRQQMLSVPFALSTPFEPATGSIIMHHDYGGHAPVPAGWMICDGSVVDQEAYDAQHGTGSWERDGIVHSPIAGKVTPNLVSRYAIGASGLTWNGSGPVETVGNAGHTIDLSHSHTVNPHRHRWITTDSNGYSLRSYNSSGSLVSLSRGHPNTGFRIVLDTAQEGVVGSYFTDEQSPGTSSDLLSSQSIQPESVEVFYIIKL